MKTFKEFINLAEQLKPLKTPEELAKKHNVSISYMKKQFKDGLKIECEHTKSDEYALRIASHHLDEFPDYYERLIKMEAESKKSAIRRKRQQDPSQQEKSGASKPTMVKTFSGGKKNKHYIKAEPTLKEATKDIPGKGSGTKDACYYKVKSRFKVWPSAYGSASLVKCRKVGAANWGNKSKGKVNEEYTRLQETGNTYSILLSWRGTYRMIQFFVPGFIRPSKDSITNEVDKIYPGAKVLNYRPSIKDPTKPYFFYNCDK